MLCSQPAAVYFCFYVIYKRFWFNLLGSITQLLPPNCHSHPCLLSIQDNGTEVSQLLVNSNQWASADDWFKYSSQMSDPVALEAGQPILLTASHANQGSVVGANGKKVALCVTPGFREAGERSFDGADLLCCGASGDQGRVCGVDSFRFAQTFQHLMLGGMPCVLCLPLLFADHVGLMCNYIANCRACPRWVSLYPLMKGGGDP